MLIKSSKNFPTKARAENRDVRSDQERRASRLRPLKGTLEPNTNTIYSEIVEKGTKLCFIEENSPYTEI